MTAITEKKICTRCVIDSDVPGARFDADGVCNYCQLHEALEREWPRGEVGRAMLESLVERIKESGKGKRVDCIVGVSGGTDSTYLLYFAKKLGLRPLAVHFDNGWDSEIAVNNIAKSLRALELDLDTYVVDWEEYRDILVSFLKASYLWPDAPTDLAIDATLYRVAERLGVQYILNGSSFRTEGKMPTEWTYLDGRTLRHIQERFGTKGLKSFPNLTLLDFLYYSFVKRIRVVRPLNFIEYHKDQARELLEKELGWQYYGGHHYESIYTRFVYSHLLPEKFKIDKRKITHSALVRSGEMTREKALEELSSPPYPEGGVRDDIEYVMKKLELSQREFDQIMSLPPKSYRDYPSYYPLVERLLPIAKPLLRLALSWTPPMLYEKEARSADRSGQQR